MIVGGARRVLDDGHDVEGGFTQRANHGEVAALIGEKARRHRAVRRCPLLGVGGLLMGHRVRRKQYRGTDVLEREIGVGIEEISFGCPLTELA